MIKDFAVFGRGHDIVDLRAVSTIVSFKDLVRNHVEQVGPNVEITGTDGDKIVLENTDAHLLEAHHFVF